MCTSAQKRRETLLDDEVATPTAVVEDEPLGIRRVRDQLDRRERLASILGHFPCSGKLEHIHRLVAVARRSEVHTAQLGCRYALAELCVHHHHLPCWQSRDIPDHHTVAGSGGREICREACGGVCLAGHRLGSCVVRADAATQSDAHTRQRDANSRVHRAAEDQLVGARTVLSVARISRARVAVVATVGKTSHTRFVLADIPCGAGIAVGAKRDVGNGRAARCLVADVVGAQVGIVAVEARTELALAASANFCAIANVAVGAGRRVVGGGTETSRLVAAFAGAHIAVVHAGLRYKAALARRLVADVGGAQVVVIATDHRRVHTQTGHRIARVAYRAGIAIVAGLKCPRDAGFAKALIGGRTGIAVSACCGIGNGRAARCFVAAVIGADVAVVAVQVLARLAETIPANFGAIARIAVQARHRVVRGGALAGRFSAGFGRAEVFVVRTDLGREDALARYLVAAVVGALHAVVTRDFGVDALTCFGVTGVDESASIVVIAVDGSTYALAVLAGVGRCAEIAIVACRRVVHVDTDFGNATVLGCARILVVAIRVGRALWRRRANAHASFAHVDDGRRVGVIAHCRVVGRNAAFGRVTRFGGARVTIVRAGNGTRHHTLASCHIAGVGRALVVVVAGNRFAGAGTATADVPSRTRIVVRAKLGIVGGGTAFAEITGVVGARIAVVARLQQTYARSKLGITRVDGARFLVVADLGRVGRGLERAISRDEATRVVGALVAVVADLGRMLAVTAFDSVAPVVGALVAVVAGARRVVTHTETVADIVGAFAAVITIACNQAAYARTRHDARANLHRGALGRTWTGGRRACTAAHFVAGVHRARAAIVAIRFGEQALAGDRVTDIVRTRVLVVADLGYITAAAIQRVARIGGTRVVVVACLHREYTLSIARVAPVFGAQGAIGADLISKRALARFQIARIVGALVAVVAGLRRVHALTVRAAVGGAAVVVVAVRIAHATHAGRDLELVDDHLGAGAGAGTRHLLEGAAGDLVTRVVGACVVVVADQLDGGALPSLRVTCVVGTRVVVGADLVDRRALARLDVAAVCRTLVAVVAGLRRVHARTTHTRVGRAGIVVVAAAVKKAADALTRLYGSCGNFCTRSATRAQDRLVLAALDGMAGVGRARIAVVTGLLLGAAVASFAEILSALIIVIAHLRRARAAAGEGIARAGRAGVVVRTDLGRVGTLAHLGVADVGGARVVVVAVRVGLALGLGRANTDAAGALVIGVRVVVVTDRAVQGIRVNTPLRLRAGVLGARIAVVAVFGRVLALPFDALLERALQTIGAVEWNTDVDRRAHVHRSFGIRTSLGIGRTTIAGDVAFTRHHENGSEQWEQETETDRLHEHCPCERSPFGHRSVSPVTPTLEATNVCLGCPCRRGDIGKS